MNHPSVDRIVNALLYEGYNLYPYRHSGKNRQCWSFGTLYPPGGDGAQAAEPSTLQTEVLVQTAEGTRLDIAVRFLHRANRVIGQFDAPSVNDPKVTEVPYREVESLQIGERRVHRWHEAEERTIEVSDSALHSLIDRPRECEFAFPSRREREFLRDSQGQYVGTIVREERELRGIVALTAERLTEEYVKVTVRVENRSPRDHRAADWLHGLHSTHIVLALHKGTFISLLDPPEACRELAQHCRNVGVQPILVGKEGDADTMLASPIILYDYPEIATESAGDHFDGTEIDEILTLRILTLTDDEKRTMLEMDGRTRDLLTRTEALGDDHLRKLHGGFRTSSLSEGSNGHE